jgi:ubiquinone/menaquinone biosynthesis C-methylase UbiE
METRGNIYERQEVADEEKKRLQTLEYPVSVSEGLLGEDIKGKTILDLGSGPNALLGKFAKEHEAKYVALDINLGFLVEQKRGGNNAVLANVDALPFKKESADMVHMRFVLMHLSPEQRKKAIVESI